MKNAILLGRSALVGAALLLSGRASAGSPPILPTGEATPPPSSQGPAGPLGVQSAAPTTPATPVAPGATATSATAVPPAALAPGAPDPVAHVSTSPVLQTGQHFTIDPVADGALIGGSLAITGILGLILSTGEIRPELPGPTSNLLGIDRSAVTQHIDPNAGTYSNVALYAAVGFAALDPFLSAHRDGWDAAIVDAVMYAESITLTEALTEFTKIAVRRPRPIDYVNCPVSVTPAAAGCASNTDLDLSFFSGHASIVATIGATATYLAFQRAGSDMPRPWITLGASVAMSTFVSIERVRAGQHFPTDVIAGSIAGAMIGVLVPHLHRHPEEAPRVWIGFAPVPSGGSLTLGGRF